MTTTPAEIIPSVLSPSADNRERTCLSCGEPFFPMFASFRNQQECADCLDARNQHQLWPAQRREILASSPDYREVQWRGICPAIYQQSERDRLPLPDLFDRVQAWEYGPTGLLLTGPTGTGKSRAIWARAKREFIAGRTVAALRSDAGLKFAAQYQHGTVDAERWVERYCRVGLLLLDDAFKAKITDSYEQAVFTILERRTSNKLPHLVALNDTAQSLAARMSPDRADALIRRLAKFAEVIQFQK